MPLTRKRRSLFPLASALCYLAASCSSADKTAADMRTGEQTASDMGAGIADLAEPPRPDLLSLPAPALTGASPAKGSTQGGIAVTLAGSNFQPGARVTIGGTPAVVTSVSPGQIVFTLPASLGFAGRAPLFVQNPDGKMASLSGDFLYYYSNISFAPPVAYLTGTSPQNIVAEDYNKDKKVDLAVINPGSGNISVLLGNGDGTFQAALSTATFGNVPSSLAKGDLDGDGTTDLIAGSYNGVSVSTLMGKGDGTFTVKGTYPAGAAADAPLEWVSLADFDGNGNLDVVAANAGSTGSVNILLGKGDGTLQSMTKISAGHFPESVVVADLNKDNKPDLLLANGANASFTVLLGMGGLNFQAPVDYAIGSISYWAEVADFDDDGRPDVAAVNSLNSNISIRLGVGDGTLQNAKNYATGGGPNSFRIRDIDGDGVLDLLVSNANSNNLSILLGAGNGTFQAPINISTGLHPVWIEPGDFNRDGKMDLAVSNNQSNNLYVLLNTSQ